MGENDVNNVKKTSSQYTDKKHQKFKKGNPGRPKGAKNKITLSAKENIEKAFEKLGGVNGLIKWAGKSNYNMTKLYDWYFSMLPRNVDANVLGNIGITLNRIITDQKPDNNGNGNDY